MTVTVHFHITRDRAGHPVAYAATRSLVVPLGRDAAHSVRSRLAADYRVPVAALEIRRIDF